MTLTMGASLLTLFVAIPASAAENATGVRMERVSAGRASAGVARNPLGFRISAVIAPTSAARAVNPSGFTITIEPGPGGLDPTPSGAVAAHWMLYE